MAGDCRGPGPAPDVRYARIVRAFNPDRKPDPPISRKFSALPRTDRGLSSHVGSLTYSGMVTKITSSSLAVRTRSEGEKIFVLRPDTRYMEGGSLTEISTLKENVRVFRPGRPKPGWHPRGLFGHFGRDPVSRTDSLTARAGSSGPRRWTGVHPSSRNRVGLELNTT